MIQVMSIARPWPCLHAAGLDARLVALQAAQPQLLLLDPPAAVRALQHREAMLAPLAGQPLLLRQVGGCGCGVDVARLCSV